MNNKIKNLKKNLRPFFVHYSRYIATLVKLITKSNFPEIGMLLVSFDLSGNFKENQKYRKDTSSNATIL